MIRIRVLPKEYTRNELKNIFIKETGNTSDEDFSEFISAMQKTNQLLQTDRNMFRPLIDVEIKTPTYQYLTIQPEKKKPSDKGIVAKKDTISVFRWTKKTGRIAIRAGKEFIDDKGTPVQIKLLKIYKDGKWIKIPRNQQPIISATKSPRMPNTIEAYRSEIPSAIVDKYDLEGNEPIRVRIDRIVKNYLSYLQLYGFEIDAISFFGETANATADTRHQKGIRDMELHGMNFPYETKGDIIDELRKRGDKALNITQAWLEKHDEGYAFLFGYSKRKDITAPNEGASVIPLVEKPEEETNFLLRDLEKDRIVLEMRGSLPENWYNLGLNEVLTRSDINTVRDNRTGSRRFGGNPSYQSTLDNKSGFKKGRK